jgi:hypothetical protein
VKAKIRSLEAVFQSPHDGLKSLSVRTAFLQEANQALLEVLPAEAADHIQVAECAGQRLVIVTDSAAWATRLRYQSSRLSRVLPAHLGIAVNRVEVRVRSRPAPAPAPIYNRQMSHASRRLLTQTAAQLSDKSLADAILRLARAGHNATGG